MTLSELQAKFPKDSKTLAYTGYIPMGYFIQNEAEIRQVLRAEGLRVYYRGPRPRGFGATKTLRADAVAAVVYNK